MQISHFRDYTEQYKNVENVASRCKWQTIKTVFDLIQTIYHLVYYTELMKDVNFYLNWNLTLEHLMKITMRKINFEYCLQESRLKAPKRNEMHSQAKEKYVILYWVRPTTKKTWKTGYNLSTIYFSVTPLM